MSSESPPKTVSLDSEDTGQHETVATTAKNRTEKAEAQPHEHSTEVSNNDCSTHSAKKESDYSLEKKVLPFVALMNDEQHDTLSSSYAKNREVTEGEAGRLSDVLQISIDSIYSWFGRERDMELMTLKMQYRDLQAQAHYSQDAGSSVVGSDEHRRTHPHVPLNGISDFTNGTTSSPVQGLQNHDVGTLSVPAAQSQQPVTTNGASSLRVQRALTWSDFHQRMALETTEGCANAHRYITSLTGIKGHSAGAFSTRGSTTGDFTVRSRNSCVNDYLRQLGNATPKFGSGQHFKDINRWYEALPDADKAEFRLFSMKKFETQLTDEQRAEIKRLREDGGKRH